MMKYESLHCGEHIQSRPFLRKSSKISDPYRLAGLVWIVAGVMSCLIFAVSALSQTVKPTPDDKELLEWQNRVNTLTEEIVSESSSVSDSERALYLAVLARIWWKSDEQLARGHLKKSADKVLSALRADDRSELARRLKYVQRTLRVFAELDEKLSQTLIGNVEKAIEGNDFGANSEDAEMAGLMATLGLQVVGSNPGTALTCGLNSLKFGLSKELANLFAVLYVKDPKLGESLYRLALKAANDNYSNANYAFMGSLGWYIFDDDGKSGAFSNSIRISYLERVTDLVSGAALIEAERQNRCMIVFLAPQMLPRIDKYLPVRSQTIRQNIQTCIPFADPYTREYTAAEARSDDPQTVDDLIKAAKDSRDPASKVRYFRKAILLLEKAKKYEDIVSLLDSLDGDDLKAMAYGWDDWRVEYAFLAAFLAFENADIPSVYRIIGKTPQKNRPYVRYRLIYRLSPTKDRDLMLENLEAIRKEVSAPEVPPKHAAGNFLSLARLYLKIQPTESEVMFREAVKYINKADSENPNFDPIQDWAPLMDYVQIPWELLDADESSITSSLANISSRRSRVRLKLGLLESSLTKYVAEKKKYDEQRKSSKPKIGIVLIATPRTTTTFS